MAGAAVEIKGDRELQESLKYLEQKTALRLGKAMATRMAQIYAKHIRKKIEKSIRPKTSDRGIGYRLITKGSTFTAKVGVGIGKARANALNVVNRGKRKGVGVSANNLIWFGLGTKDRFTGSKKSGNERRWTGHKRHFTGRIDKQKWGGFMQAGIKSGEGEAITAAREVFDKKLDQEIAKARSRS